ncbi:MAG: segregation/condensation protein A [Treponema sp.]|nr:MAG: segregation/condensation protein A [Treponema sp.]
MEIGKAVDTVNIEGSKSEFKTEHFQGPLELLLFLINKNEVNIYDIPISEITEQYLEYLDYAISPELDNLTEFYSMATTLLYIKSTMLLPVEVSLNNEDIEDPRQSLVDKLIEYQKYKKLSELMEERENETEWFFERKKIQTRLPFGEEQLWKKMDTWDLLTTFSRLIAGYNSQKLLDVYEEVSVSEKVALMNELLEKNGECMFTELIVRKGNLLDIVCAFMAILEAVKIKMASVWQHSMFGDIKIKPWEEIQHSVIEPDTHTAEIKVGE